MLRRLAALAVALVLCATLRAQQLTAVQDHLGNGPLRITVVAAETFTTADGYLIPQGWTASSSSSNGVVNLSVPPNAGSDPSGSFYTVTYDEAGVTSTHTWVVPASTTPVTLAQVTANVSIVLTPMAVPLSEVTPLNGCASQVLAVNSAGTGWDCVPNGGGVNSVFGRTGAVVAATGDYSFSQISGTAATSQIPWATPGNIGSTTAADGYFAALFGAALPDCSAATADKLLYTKSTGLFSCGTDQTASGSGGGTVTSVAMTVPSWLAVSGSPVTTSGTLGLSLASQTANQVFAAPDGSAGAPAFRALALADLPGSGAVTVSTSSPISGGGAVSLGGSLTLSCPTCLTAVPAPASSTLGGVQSYTAPAHEWLSALSTSGTWTASQPAFADLSGSPTAAQIAGAGTLSNATTGNAATATALAATPTLCGSGQAAQGILASGDATGCFTPAAGGSSAFSAITSGTNTAAAMVVGSGATLSAAGTGTINANQLQGATVSAQAPTSGQVLAFSGGSWVPMTATGCLNVLNYGAKGDDTTDDTAAVQNAITAANNAGGGCIFFPPTGSKYLIDGELVIPDNTGNNPPTQDAIEFVGSGAGVDGSNAGGPPNGGSQLDLRSSQQAAPATPAVTPTTGTGSLAAGTYYVEVTYVDDTAGVAGQTTVSSQASATLSAAGELTVTSPASPGEPYAYNVYIGTTSGGETLQNASPVALGTNYVQSAALASGAAVPGSNTTTAAKIVTLGRGTLDIYGLALTDYGTDCAPFLATTNTTVYIRGVSFWGTHAAAAACNDAIILGSSNPSLTPTANAYSLFQGYGTVIQNNFFGQVRQAVWAGTAANSVMIENNTVWMDSGDTSAAQGAITFECNSGGSECDRDYIAGNLIEVANYANGMYFDYTVNAFLTGNQFWDAGTTTQQDIYGDGHDGYFTILDSNPVQTKPLLNSGAPSSFEVISSGSGGAVSNFTNPVNFRGQVTNYGPVANQGIVSFTGNWELRYLNETASYSLNQIDQVVTFDCSAGCTATLPTAVNAGGQTHCVVQTGSGAVTVDPQSGDSIDGTTAYDLTTAYSEACFISDGNHNWWTWVSPGGSGAGMTDPMTTLGDLIYGGTSGAATRLAGNTTTTPEYLQSTGASSAAGAPVWAALTGASIPVFGPSGTNHAPGAVPDPGATAGTTRYLREDGTWDVPAGGSAPTLYLWRTGAGTAAAQTWINATIIALATPAATISASKLVYDVSTADTTAGDYYSMGIYGPCAPGTASCAAVCTTSAVTETATGVQTAACTQTAPVTLAPAPSGEYYYLVLGSVQHTAQYADIAEDYLTPVCATTPTTISGGQVPSAVAVPAEAWSTCGYEVPQLALGN